jgi:NADH-quinone oxidoreductase subunit C
MKPMSAFDQILSLVKTTCTHGDCTVDENSTPKAIKIDKKDLIPVMQSLLNDPVAYFDMLSCVSGVDNGPDAGTMEIVYNLYSIPFDHHLMIKVIVPRDKPEVESVCQIWKTANWHEREVFDLFGINFLDHPDLRRILLPADWEGHPMRKDYKHQEYYRNVKVEY